MKEIQDRARHLSSTDEVKYLAVQNHDLTKRLTAAESDIAELKKMYIDLKDSMSSSCAESKTSDIHATTSEDMAPLNIMSIEMVSIGSPNSELVANPNHRNL